MIIIVYSETNAGNVETRLGEAEYSYYFVLKAYRRVLERMGIVVAVADPAHEVDRIHRNAAAHGESCIFLSFTPPQLTLLGLQCPTVPVFAWEFATLPHEVWDDNPRNDWRLVFNTLGHAITHSGFVVRAVKEVMGQDFPIVSIPAPVWERFSGFAAAAAPVCAGARLAVTGTVVDTAAPDFVAEARTLPDPTDAPVVLELSGVIYCAVFNPADGRKNWHDMLCGFCLTFRDDADATLVFKLTYYGREVAFRHMLETIYRLTPFKCRVILIHGYLDDADFETLVNATSFVVNASAGEGQCLPLMEFMSAGKPAIAPRNTAQLDYVNAENSFEVATSMEPWCWPHDTRQAFRTLRHRIDFSSLTAAYRASHDIAIRDQPRYRAMSRAASRDLGAHCSDAVTERRLRDFLAANLGQAARAALLDGVAALAE